MTEQPSRQTIESAVELANRAPSVHNTQPWQWRESFGMVELFADRTRRLELEDPHGRSLLISCGAALQHFGVAMEVSGWRAHIRRLPDHQVPSLLAAVRFSTTPASARAVGWAEVITRRRSAPWQT